VLVFADLRVGEWVGLPKQECWGAGGLDCENEDSKACSTQI